jgi:hypothetical protein
MKIPHADEGTVCPLHKVDCSTVCHKCPWWTRVVGKNPQSEEMVDDWRCAVAWIPMLLIENSQQQRGTQAAVETLRNEIDRFTQGLGEAMRLASAQQSNGRLTDARDHNR